MKTAISVPESTFERVSVRARALGMSRSEFFARAAGRYLDELDQSSVTAQINAALEAIPGADDSSEAAVDAGRRLLGAGNEW